MARLIRMSEVCRDSGLSKWTINRLEAAGEFPKRFPISAHAVAFDGDEYNAWKAERKAARMDEPRRRSGRPARGPSVKRIDTRPHEGV